MPRIAPSRGTHLLLDRGRPARPATAACIVPAGEGRTIFALPWYGRTLVGTTDNDYDGDIDHPQPGGDDVDYLLDAVNDFFGTALGAVRPGRRLRRGAAADLDRRPEEVGRHLAQGRALRDLLGDADDHRRQAHHLAADGEADRRPPGRARGPRGALPHGRDPARDGGAAGGPRGARRESGRRRSTQLAFRYGHAARAVLDLARGARRSWRAPIVPGRPDLLAEVVIAARHEQARSVADVLLRRTRLGLLAAPQLRDARRVAAGRRGARRASSAGAARRISLEAEAWAEVSRGRGPRSERGTGEVSAAGISMPDSSAR